MKRFCSLLAMLLTVVLLLSGCSFGRKQTEGPGTQGEGNVSGDTYGDETVFQTSLFYFDSWDFMISTWAVYDSEIYVLRMDAGSYCIVVCNEKGEPVRRIDLPALKSEIARVFCGMFVDDAMQIWTISSEPTDNPNEATTYGLYCFSQEGELLLKQNLNEIIVDGDPWNFLDFVVGQGLFFLNYYGEENGIAVLSEKGEYLGNIRTGTGDPGRILKDRAGNLYYANTDQEKVVLYEIDADSFSLSQQARMLPPVSIKWIQPGLDSDFLAATGDGIYELSLDSEEATPAVDFESEGINSTIRGFYTTGDNTVLLVTFGFAANGNVQLVSLSKVPVSQAKEKKKLTLVTLSADPALYQQVLTFNQKSEDYRIQVKEYFVNDGVANVETAVESAVTQLNADLAAGVAGDLIDLESLSTMASVRAYVKKGVLENLDGYLEGQEQEWISNLRSALEIDGELYQMVPSFYLRTVAGRTSIVGERQGWSLEDYNRMRAEYPELKPFSYGTKQEALYYALMYNQKEWIDWESAECFFDTDSFAGYLEFADQFPDQSEYEELPPYWNNAEEIYNGDVLLYDADRVDIGMYDIRRIQGVMGEQITWIGFPVEEGVGVVFDPVINLGVLSSSDQKEAAGEFIRYFLSDEFQKSQTGAFPVREQILYENMEQIRKDNPGSMDGWGSGTIDMSFGDIQEDQVESVQKLLQNASQTNQTDSVIVDIMQEEAAYYFAGERSAAEAAQRIQDRVSLYLKEQN